MQKIITLIQLEMQMKQQSYAESAFRGRGSPVDDRETIQFYKSRGNPFSEGKPPIKISAFA